jgi:hypothetical protein
MLTLKRTSVVLTQTWILYVGHTQHTLYLISALQHPEHRIGLTAMDPLQCPPPSRVIIAVQPLLLYNWAIPSSPSQTTEARESPAPLCPFIARLSCAELLSQPCGIKQMAQNRGSPAERVPTVDPVPGQVHCAPLILPLSPGLDNVS